MSLCLFITKELNFVGQFWFFEPDPTLRFVTPDVFKTQNKNKR